MKKAAFHKARNSAGMSALHRRAGKLLGGLYTDTTRGLMEMLYNGEKFKQALDSLEATLCAAQEDSERQDMIRHSWMKNFVIDD